MKIRKILLSLITLFALTSCNKYYGPHELADGADRTLTHEDSKYYTFNDYYNMESEGSLIIISHFETYQQILSYSCGCCSAWMVLNYYDKATASTLTEEGIANEMGSTGGGVGTCANQIAKFFTDRGYEVEKWCSHGKTFPLYADFKEFVEFNLNKGYPIMVDWAIGGGHWTTIIGFDDMGTEEAGDDVLIFADSSDNSDHNYDGYTIFSANRFFSMWRETTPWDGEQIYLQQYVVVYPK